MQNIIKKTISILSSTAVVLSSFAAITLSVPASAATVTLLGNDSTARTQVDTGSGFTVIDTNHPATSAGQITSFGYYASNVNPFSFVVVDSSNMVKYVSLSITPTASGANTYTPTSPVPVQTGDNLGVYFSSTGTIPFESTGALASGTATGSSVPTVGSTLVMAGYALRTYSFVGDGTTLTSVTVSPTTKTVNVGGTQQLTVNPLDQNNAAFVGATVSYASSNTAVATVSTSGLVTGVSVGTATVTVTATSGTTSVTATSVVTVNNTTGGGDDEEEDEHYDSNRQLHESEDNSSTNSNTITTSNANNHYSSNDDNGRENQQQTNHKTENQKNDD